MPPRLLPPGWTREEARLVDNVPMRSPDLSGPDRPRIPHQSDLTQPTKTRRFARIVVRAALPYHRFPFALDPPTWRGRQVPAAARVPPLTRQRPEGFLRKLLCIPIHGKAASRAFLLATVSYRKTVYFTLQRAAEKPTTYHDTATAPVRIGI